MKNHFFVLLVISLFQMHAGAFENACPAPSMEQLEREYGPRASLIGWNATLDWTEDARCFQASSSCERKVISDPGESGYYEEHSVFLILHQERVLFASTSPYFELTYGSLLGDKNAERNRDEAFRQLIEEGLCR